jgi:hypothetical protein
MEKALAVFVAIGIRPGGIPIEVIERLLAYMLMACFAGAALTCLVGMVLLTVDQVRK